MNSYLKSSALMAVFLNEPEESGKLPGKVLLMVGLL
jgi:hypothetical protein